MKEKKNTIENIPSNIEQLYWEIWKKVIGQKILVRDLLIALFSRGHILIEWAPGLAKTLTVDSLAKTLDLDFKRIQFTPDLLPSDLIGNNVYNPAKNDFYIKHGPIFSNFLLADEINRAPSKVQSALLEAMSEKQVSIWDTTFPLDLPFIVLATQNPIEQEWTFQLPEAQLDRFLLKTVVDYPSEEEELEILRNIKNIENTNIEKIFKKSDIFIIQEKVENIYVDENILVYIKNLVFYTRMKNTKISQYISYPVSPRASLALLKTAKTLAFLNGRDFVIPEDIKEMAYPVLRHRLILNYEALAEEIEVDSLIKIILDNVEVK